MNRFIIRLRIRSSHCDPQGRLQAARYFELVNRVVEEWFGDPLEFSFAYMHSQENRIGIPTARLVLETHQPAYLGEELEISLQVLELRRSAIKLAIDASCENQPRFSARVVIVLAEASSGRLRSMEIPADLRAAMERYSVPAI
ncbi:acyl-CoA thioesterase [Marinobacter sp.]|uniref:acyl-CoA thioesterase n=1 Tax=Marinobacter sp. TaxID=50741 RepID=UPI00384DC45D